MQLAKEIYLLTGKFPSEEKFGLSRRCGVQRFPFHPISLRVRPGTQRVSLFNLSPMQRAQLPKSTRSFGYP